MTYEESISYIHSLMRFGSRPGLERIKKLLEALGNPQKALKIIHVAGTNGKGSTCVFISSALCAAGLNVGMYISPYVTKFNERIQINGEYIPDDKLAELTERLKPVAESVGDTDCPITEFEFITALGFLWFAESRCDCVVLEVGLGGRLDATNVIDKPLVSVIARIALDHTAILGDTPAKIAFEKCGIIKKCCPVVTTADNSAEAMSVIKSRAAEEQSQLTISDLADATILSSDIFGSIFEYNGHVYRINLPGKHQISNAVTAIEAVSAAFPEINSETVAKGFAAAEFPARCELISKEPFVLLDGSHNPNGTTALEKLLTTAGINDAVGIIGFMADKDVSTALKTVLPHFAHILTVTVNSNSRTMSADALAITCAELSSDASPSASYIQAIEKAEQFGLPIVVFGSLYLAGDIRPLLLSRFSTKNN